MTPRPFMPLEPDHPMVTQETICPICKTRIVAGDIVCLLVGEQIEEWLAEGIPAHWNCWQSVKPEQEQEQE